MISSRPARLTVARLEPVSEPRVQPRAQLLRHRRVGDVADQHMVEAEAVVAGKERAVGAYELLAPERQQRAADPRSGGVIEQLADRAAVEEAALDRAALDDGALLRLEPVDARGEERLDRRRHRVGLGVVAEVREQLLDEERVPFRGRDDPLAQLRRELVRERVDELVRVVVAERLEDDERRAPTRRSPRRPHVEEIGASGAEDEDRCVARRVRDVLDQVEQRRVGPVDVVDDQHERPRRGERLEHSPERPGGLVGRAASVPLADRPGDEPRREVAVSVAREELVEIADVAHDVREREVGHALAVGSAAADHDPRLVGERVEQLARESRLPDPGRADDRGERGGAARDRVVERGAEQRELVPPADERGRDRPGERGHVRPEPDKPVGGERLALALGVEGRRRLGVDEVRDGRIGSRAEQHLAGLGRLLEPGRDVDGVAGRQLLVPGPAADDDLAGVDPGARDDLDAVLPRKLLVERPQSVADPRGRANRAERVVLAHRRHAEHGHHRVADELLDGAAVPLEHGLHRLEVPPHHAAQQLRVEPLAERRRPGHVGEEDGDDLARLRLGRSEARPASGAEARVGGVLAPAVGAGHAREPSSAGGPSGPWTARWFRDTLH